MYQLIANAWQIFFEDNSRVSSVTQIIRIRICFDSPEVLEPMQTVDFTFLDEDVPPSPLMVKMIFSLSSIYFE